MTHRASPHGGFVSLNHPRVGKSVAESWDTSLCHHSHFPSDHSWHLEEHSAFFSEWLRFQSPGAIEIEIHCPERFNKIVFQPQRWAPSHLPLPSSIPWLTGNQSPEKLEYRKDNNSPVSKQLQHRKHLHFWAVAVTEINAHLYLPQHLQYLILQNTAQGEQEFNGICPNFFPTPAFEARNPYLHHQNR